MFRVNILLEIVGFVVDHLRMQLNWALYFLHDWWTVRLVRPFLIPSYLHHHDGAVGGHAGVEAGGEVAVVLVEDGAHGGVLAGDGYGQDGVVWFDGLGVGQVEGEAVAAHGQSVA